jgi:hypothetical protein
VTEPERQRLTAILGMLGSTHAGERAAAALQAEALRRKLGLTWAELLASQEDEPPSPPPPPARTPEPQPAHQPQPAPQVWARPINWEVVGGFALAVSPWAIIALLPFFRH